jgi:hypothetical protein
MHKTLKATIFLLCLLLIEHSFANDLAIHEYKVDQNGKISLIKQTEAEFDLLIVVFNNKAKIRYNEEGLPKQEYIRVKKGIIANCIELKDFYKGRKVNGLKLSFGEDYDEALKVFEFLADHTAVEWSLLNYGDDQFHRTNLYTSYYRTLEYFGAKRTYTLMNAANITSLTHYHNHPRSSSEKFGQYAFPSYPDLRFRDKVQESTAFNVNFKIRTDEIYIDYTNQREWPSDALL